MTNTALSTSQTDVNNAINGGGGFSPLGDGDTCIVPYGSSTWTSAISITKGITLIGAGIGSSVITDNVAGHNLISISGIGPSQNIRISGFTFTNNGGSFSTNSNATITANIQSGSTYTTRFDNLYFNNTYALQAINLSGASSLSSSCLGVIDHCTFLTTHQVARLYIEHDSFLNVGSFGDNSWAQPTNWGSSQALFIEDCTFTGQSAAAAIDSCGGARWVLRHSTVNQANVGGHGTDTTGRTRGTRSREIYLTDFIAGTSGAQERNFAIHSRSGTALIWGNTFGDNTGLHSYDTLITCDNFRTWYGDPATWAGADGTNPWDSGDIADHTGNGYNGSTGGVFATGTASTASSGTTMTDTVHPGTWTTNQWKGYTLRNTTKTPRVNGSFGIITSNTSTTITVAGNTDGPNLSFAMGDSYDIRKLLIILDGNGRGQGTLLSGSTASPVTAFGGDALEPIYVWNNVFYGTGNGNGKPLLATGAPQVVGTDVIGQTANNGFACPLNYSSSVGTCGTPFSGYTPFTYPHPLVTGGVTTGGGGKKIIRRRR